MRKIKFVFVLFSLLMLAGCNYFTEPEGQYMVTTLGFEETRGGFTVYLQAVDLKKGEQNGNPDTFTVKGEGKTPQKALTDAKTTLGKTLSIKHCELIVLSDTVSREGIEKIFSLCDALEIPFKTRLCVCADIEKLLSYDGVSAGFELSSLIRQNANNSGFGGHTALYEIKTAVQVSDGDFALPVLKTEGEVKVAGLLVFEGGEGAEYLDFDQSINYAKKHGLNNRKGGFSS